MYLMRQSGRLGQWGRSDLERQYCRLGQSDLLGLSDL
jgi:hypothetical protein